MEAKLGDINRLQSKTQVTSWLPGSDLVYLSQGDRMIHRYMMTVGPVAAAVGLPEVKFVARKLPLSLFTDGDYPAFTLLGTTFCPLASGDKVIDDRGTTHLVTDTRSAIIDLVVSLSETESMSINPESHTAGATASMKGFGDSNPNIRLLSWLDLDDAGDEFAAAKAFWGTGLPLGEFRPGMNPEMGLGFDSLDAAPSKHLAIGLADYPDALVPLKASSQVFVPPKPGAADPAKPPGQARTGIQAMAAAHPLITFGLSLGIGYLVVKAAAPPARPARGGRR